MENYAHPQPPPLAPGPAEACRQGVMDRLVSAVQELSLARTLDDIMRVVRTAARELTDADGATFVLREGDYSYYADEDAVAALFKGQRFPLGDCIGGWSILHRLPAVVDDVDNDPRIPPNLYRKTFVRSLVMVPIRSEEPVGAIGCYWARQHHVGEAELHVIQALADTTSVALENVTLYQDMLRANRGLQQVNAELEELTYAASHDLKAPLRAVANLAYLVDQDSADHLDEENRRRLRKLRSRIVRMDRLLDALLAYAREGRIATGVYRSVPLGELLGELVDTIGVPPDFHIELTADLPVLTADPVHLRHIFHHLLSNAIEHHDRSRGHVVVSATDEGASWCIEVADDGPGMPPISRESPLALFATLGAKEDSVRAGIGLVLVRKLVLGYGGTVEVARNRPRGTRVRITWPKRVWRG